MYLDDFYKRFTVDESLADAIGFNPYYCEIKSGLGGYININDRQFINLASNNYLGLADNPEVKGAVMEAVKRYGASMCGTPIATGYIELYRKAEEKLSAFIGLEDSIILPSGYQANNGLFSAIAGSEDLIIVDRYAHSSLVQGIWAAGCKIRPFLHNNMEHLQEILSHAKKYRQVFVVTESVFSTDGSIAPFKEITDLCREYRAVPVVDDSHGIGVIGRSGKGILEDQEILNYEGIYTASLGKALANAGGVISGRREIINYLKYYCPHLVYSTALPPSILGGLVKVLDMIHTEFHVLSKPMWKYKAIVNQGLTDNGFHVAEGRAPINSIHAGSSGNTIALAKSFFENHILTTPFIAPSVPVEQGKVRLIAGANLTEDAMDRVLNAIRKIGREP